MFFTNPGGPAGLTSEANPAERLFSIQHASRNAFYKMGLSFTLWGQQQTSAKKAAVPVRRKGLRAKQAEQVPLVHIGQGFKLARGAQPQLVAEGFRLVPGEAAASRLNSIPVKQRKELADAIRKHHGKIPKAKIHRVRRWTKVDRHFTVESKDAYTFLRGFLHSLKKGGKSEKKRDKEVANWLNASQHMKARVRSEEKRRKPRDIAFDRQENFDQDGGDRFPQYLRMSLKISELPLKRAVELLGNHVVDLTLGLRKGGPHHTNDGQAEERTEIFFPEGVKLKVDTTTGRIMGGHFLANERLSDATNSANVLHNSNKFEGLSIPMLCDVSVFAHQMADEWDQTDLEFPDNKCVLSGRSIPEVLVKKIADKQGQHISQALKAVDMEDDRGRAHNGTSIPLLLFHGDALDYVQNLPDPSRYNSQSEEDRKACRRGIWASRVKDLDWIGSSGGMGRGFVPTILDGYWNYVTNRSQWPIDRDLDAIISKSQDPLRELHAMVERVKKGSPKVNGSADPINDGVSRATVWGDYWAIESADGLFDWRKLISLSDDDFDWLDWFLGEEHIRRNMTSGSGSNIVYHKRRHLQAEQQALDINIETVGPDFQRPADVTGRHTWTGRPQK